MEQGVVSNNSDELVVVQFGGLNHYFEAEQERVFPIAVAQSIAREDSRLSFIAEEPRKIKTPRMRKEEVAPEPENDSMPAKPVEDRVPGNVDAADYSVKKTVNGRDMYFKNGKIISQEEYDARPRA